MSFKRIRDDIEEIEDNNIIKNKRNKIDNLNENEKFITKPIIIIKSKDMNIYNYNINLPNCKIRQINTKYDILIYKYNLITNYLSIEHNCIERNNLIPYFSCIYLFI